MPDMLSVVYESWPSPATSSGSRCVAVPRQWPKWGTFNIEPGTNQEIKEFAASYDVKFDMYSKICVNGDDAHPLWKWMKVQPKGRGMLGNAIKWNFTKFLIDKNGCVMKRYGPMEEPLVIEKDLPCYL
ncbi:glutathione peroxidase 4 precursor [Cricetulus griseus]|uniref:phospholipid-hydroperoxide glutathione peroxidase n=1 Tax=Cricetulus griseus TaxID=10029 RepID=A0A061I2Z0_CRIGR|nr:glutathione peroxidase 4 precursor [Cricetulus griseus]